MVTKKNMAGLMLALISAVSIFFIFNMLLEPSPGTYSKSGIEAVSSAYSNRLGGVPVEVAGEVSRLLMDDKERSLKQKFVMTLMNGQALLVEHAISGTERIPLAVGDQVTVSGVYYFSEPGGILRWTNRDNGPRYDGGWVEHKGRKYD